jgi:uncharacterized protein (TIGR02421 family)
MSVAKGANTKEITDRFVRTVCGRLSENKRVRRSLPGWGRVHIDRQLPFLCVYRRPYRAEDLGTDRLVTSEASYLLASGAPGLRPGLARLTRAIVETLGHQFGAFLILEIWAAEQETCEIEGGSHALRPGFKILAPKGGETDRLVADLDEALSRIKLRRQAAERSILRTARPCPRGLSPILAPEVASESRCSLLGLEVRPVYRASPSGELYPLILRELRRGLSHAMQQTFFRFARTQTTHHPKHFRVLGRHAMVKAVWEVDKQLAEVSDSFDFLLQVTPPNAEEAWTKFRKKNFERSPVFHYRPLPVDPVLLKRRLYATPMERVEDPALLLLLREKQDELDRQISMLLDINTKRFVYGSLQLYGGVGDDLKRLAEQLLYRIPPGSREDPKGGHVDAAAFARRAEEEIARYREAWPKVDAGVQIREDLSSGLMVSRGSLLIGKSTQIPVSRIEALIQHEIGTHVLTYYNGCAQPFRQLYSGLAGYEALQEGLAVLAEYLVGGLSRPRLRLLAARVLATHYMINGATFVETYRELDGLFGFNQRTAFTIAMRIYRGGGLTKDAVYLRGLRQILEYLGKGGELAPLFVGKIAPEHLPIVQELRWRKVLREPPLTPRYMALSDTQSRLRRLQEGMTVLDLVDRRQK